ncbi:NADH dehydrogenase subunit 6 (mitochondrion) [Portunus trituberculatus]|uniref:NADH-ubiquinone oxidoreductase chain 6 n=1 Tax=Portunus trituberculatus TaxID=210409 RepID=Q7Y8W2_PORTR|nr:NADH dehydrogenase subunit 6 [Portunus trituberculatus]QPD06760.1 NADH dehydrogenase subunit 6 [Portunus trituberculatus]QPF22855.1 NADH dehydrogenase subunit 6 [Portunus trituberculatus]BAC79215.1 NADH dehydrogenase subunit 6 [Portunus trituberculatus]
MTLLFIPFILLLSILFTRLSHPLSMGLTLLIQTIFISLTAGLSTYSYWFSYILFMIFLGGMLVLFIYVTSLASNEPFFFSWSALSFSLILLFMLLTLTFFWDSLMGPTMTQLPLSSFSLNSSNIFIISWIYSSNLMNFTLYIILYLLLTLVVVVKITNLFKGPFRLSP